MEPTALAPNVIVGPLRASTLQTPLRRLPQTDTVPQAGVMVPSCALALRAKACLIGKAFRIGQINRRVLADWPVELRAVNAILRSQR